MAGQGFVDRIVHHLVDHVMQAGAVVGVADIHAGALAHRVETAQNLDRIRAIGILARRVRGQGLVLVFGHSSLAFSLARRMRNL